MFCSVPRWIVRSFTVLVLVASAPEVARAGGGPPSGTPGRISSSGWQVILTVPPTHRASGLAIDMRGVATQPKWAYTADTTAGQIVKFGTGGKRILSWAYGKPVTLATSVGLAVGGNGNVFVADPAAGTVSKFSPGGRLLTRWSGFGAPVSVAVDRVGHVFVAEQDARRMTELSPAGIVLAHWSPSAIYSPGGQSAPTGVAMAPPNEVYLATSCVIGVTCGIGIATGTARTSELIDGLLEFFTAGPQRGRPIEMWFGLPHTASGPEQPPDKESEPFTAIDAMGSDAQGWLYVASTVWWRGSAPRAGVVAYTPYGYKWDTLYLPTQALPRGIAVDGRGIVYVVQGNRILAHPLGRRPSSPTG